VLFGELSAALHTLRVLPVIPPAVVLLSTAAISAAAISAVVLEAAVLAAVVISDVVLEVMVLASVVLTAVVISDVALEVMLLVISAVLEAVVLEAAALLAVLEAIALLSPSSRPRQAMATRAAACSAYRLFFSQEPELNKDRSLIFFLEKAQGEKRTFKMHWNTVI
jgi:hypothetical protein